MKHCLRVLALLPATLLLAPLLLLAGCQKETDPGPGGVTVGEGSRAG